MDPNNLGRPDLQADKAKGNMYTGSMLDQGMSKHSRAQHQTEFVAAAKTPLQPQQKHLPPAGGPRHAHRSI